MKKDLLLVIAVTSLTGLSGCSSDDENTTWGVSAPDAAITVSLPSDFAWNNDSKVGLYCAQAYDNGTVGVNNKAIAIASGADTNNAGLENAIKPGEGANKIYAYYPYSEALGENPAKVKVTIPSIQKQNMLKPTQSTNEYSFFYGAQTATSVDANPMPVNIAMKNLFCVLEFNIGTTAFGVGKQLSEIILSTDDAKLAGDFGVNLTADKVVADGASDASYASSNSITLKMEGTAGTLAATPIKARIAMNPVQLEGKQLKITVKLGNDSWEFKEDGRNYLANKVYSVDLNLTDPPLNLNEKGYSNSYMINQPNTTYKFDAKVQGNGKATTGITPQSIDPKDVFVVWESSSIQNGVIKDVKLSADGFVTFTTSSNIGGNALIAVTDGIPTEEFPKGTILWSWHIWCTDYDVSQDAAITNTEGQTFRFMKINLGALSVAPDENGYGLKYQWGRKDPFFYDGIPSSGEVTTGVVSDPMYGWQASEYSPEADGQDLSLNYSIIFPTAFFKGGFGTSLDWYGVGTGIENRNNNLWGNPENGLGNKSIYDPCPVGYRVPPQAAYNKFAKPTEGKFENNGWNFPTDNGEKIFFTTASSYLIFSSGNLSAGNWNGKSGYYWSTSTNSNTETNASGLKVESGYVANNQTIQRASGASVRCIRE